MVYDSRSNPIAASDARSSALTPDPWGLFAGQINDHGNVVHTFYDGLSRPVRSELLLKQGGVGNGQLDLAGATTALDLSNPGNPDGKITIAQQFDRNSRLVARCDDNGNQTTYVYDSRDRCVLVGGADLTASRTVYDADSQPIQSIDRNGTVTARLFDAIGRTRRVDVLRQATNLEASGQGVEGSVLQAFEYDGLSRLRLAVDQNDPLNPADDVVTSFSWDSLSRQLSERHRFRAQTSVGGGVAATFGQITVGSAAIDRTIARAFDLDSNLTETTYSSGRLISYQHDGLDRVQRIVEGALGGSAIETCEWLGGRPLRCDEGNGVRTSYGYDQKRRLAALDHVAGTGVGPRVAGTTYAWTRADQRASETHLAAPGVAARTESYSYDSASRVVAVDHGDARPDTSYLIDGVGNWVSRTEGGETVALNRRANGRYQPDLMNEVVKLTRFDALGAVLGEDAHSQDPNGNRIREAEFRLFWDAFDRLVRVERASDGQVVGRYRYDALGRRVDRSFVAKGETVAQQVYHVHDGAREVEELDAAGNVQADFVWGGLYVDELVQLRRGGQTYYAHKNSIYSVAALTDAAGNTVERYAYGSIYGVCSVQDGSGAAKSAAVEVGNPWRFQGRRWDPETGWYYFRARQLDPARGRFVSRDPLGLWGDPGQVGNSYSFAGNNPVNAGDPFGLDGASVGAQLAQGTAERIFATQGEEAAVQYTIQTGRFTFAGAGGVSETTAAGIEAGSALTGTTYTATSGAFATGAIQVAGKVVVVLAVAHAAYQVGEIIYYSGSALWSWHGAHVQEAYNTQLQAQLQGTGTQPAFAGWFTRTAGREPTSADIQAFTGALSAGQSEEQAAQTALTKSRGAKTQLGGDPCGQGGYPNVALGLDEIPRYSPGKLEEFMWHVWNVTGEPTYSDRYWDVPGVNLTDYPMSGPFELRFNQAVDRASHIHFNLTGIDNPAASAGLGGLAGKPRSPNVTNWELWQIQTGVDSGGRPLIDKTTFWINGQPQPPGFNPFR